jgi:hypothetical protein
MKSRTNADFWDLFRQLPVEEQDRAKEAYRWWQDNPNHNSLHFKRVSRQYQIYSVRVGLGYRALGLRDGDTVTWYWIGTHAEYDRLLRSA